MSHRQVFERTTQLPFPIEDVFAYHDRPGALARLSPPWEPVSISRNDGSLQPGSEVHLRVKVGPMWRRWVARHTQYTPPELFEDIQVSGPFNFWTHQHRFASNERGCTLTDHIEYQLPMGAIGNLLGSGFVRRKLEATFAYRHRVTEDDLRLGAAYEQSPMRVAISGSSGLVGSALGDLLSVLGHHPERLQRGDLPMDSDAQQTKDHYPWSDAADMTSLEAVDAVVHLAGKSIATERWNDRVKKEIMDSRVEKTRGLCQRLASLASPPKVLVCASATGIYGDRGEESLTERSDPGTGFLADVGKAWEDACEPARKAGIRVVNLRIGIVVSPKGGALEKLLLPGSLGLGGPVSSGRQWWSWIALDDLLGVILHCICTPELSGPVNATAPNSVTSREFASNLGSVLRRPAFLPAPAPALRIALGEMAGPLLLASAKVRPDQLESSGYRFRFEELTPCLRNCLGRIV